MNKTRDDVGVIFEQVLKTFKNDYTTKDVPHLKKLADYLDSFGSDVACDVLSIYLYAHPTTFFEWSKIIEILRKRLINQYDDIDTAWNKLLAAMRRYGWHTPPPIDSLNPLIFIFINETGGWVQLCRGEVEPLQKLFNKKYPIILEDVITRILEEHIGQ